MKISNIVQNISLVGGVVCGAAATEMAVRALGDLFSLATSSDNKTRKNLSANLGGAVFYGICALNIIPASRVIGATIFASYSLFWVDPKDDYLASKMIRVPIEKTIEHAVVPFCHHVIIPIWENVISPVAARIFTMIQAVLAHVRLPEHPVWYGVAVLAAIVWLKYGSDVASIWSDVRAQLNY